MPTLRAHGIDLCYETAGDVRQPAVLLVHGLGCQLVQWPASLIQGLVDGGFFVVRMDNRDAGLSERFESLGSVNLMALTMAYMGGESPKPPYTLGDMAGDAVGLLDALELPHAHIVGVSMGGMIAQRLAIHHPTRVASLTSIMSTSGSSSLPPPDPDAIRSITTPPPSDDRLEVIAFLKQTWDLIGGQYFKSTEVGMGRLIELAVDRGRYPAGLTRQMAAIMADARRAGQLGEIRARTLVIHGGVDKLVPLACGEDTAQRIPGARFVVMPQMGHDLPDPLMPQILDALLTHIRSRA